MLKITVAVLTLALAGTASAGWRSLRVDGSSEAAFQASVAAIQRELPEVRRYLFRMGLQDIRAQGEERAEAAQREYTDDQYLRDVDGLGYKDVVTFTDPSGDTADRRFRQVYAQLYRGGVRPSLVRQPTWTDIQQQPRTYPSPQQDAWQQGGFQRGWLQ